MKNPLRRLLAAGLCLLLALCLIFPAGAEGTKDVPEIVTQPSSAEVALGQTATFRVAATGGDLKYQWQYSKDSCSTWTTWSGKTAASLTVTGSATNNGCWYRCIVSNSSGSVTSVVVKLTVTGTDAAPVITTHPADAYLAIGESTTFRVAASGAGLSYQWQFCKAGTSTWYDWSGKTAATLTVTASATNGGCRYRCVVTNSYGSATSAAATLTLKTSGYDAPEITQQPYSLSGSLGQTVTFKVVATGTDLQYQWQYKKVGEADWTSWSGKTAAALSVKISTTNNGCQYRCVVSNAYGSVTSAAVTLTLNASSAPVITGQPESATVAKGSSVTFKVVASGSGLSYQWQFCKAGTSTWYDWSGKTAATLTVTGSDTNNGCKYRCAVSNSGGSVISNAATLTVTAAAAGPAITGQPANLSLALGASGSFQVTASGSNLTYQWQFCKAGTSTWYDWSGKTAAKLTVTASSTNNGCKYRCVVSNGSGSATSNAATLTVTAATGPAITGQPANLSLVLGASGSFKVTASGSNLTYQWQFCKAGTSTWYDWSGKTSATLTVTASSTNNGCKYRCVVSNGSGSTTSNAATLTVTEGAPVITTQPKSVTAEENSTVTFKVVAAGSDLTYQWQYKVNGSSWIDWANKTSASLTVKATQTNTAYSFRCVVSNSYGSTASDAVSISLVASSKPVITSQDTVLVAVPDKYVTFHVTATGGALSYQWQYSTNKGASWNDWANKTSSSLDVYVNDNNMALQYRCKVSNSLGTVYSKAATMVYIKITEQPKSVTADDDTEVSFTVKAEGSGLKYAWQIQWETEVPVFERAEWEGEFTPTLTVHTFDLLHQAQFRCKITDSYGHVVYTNVVMLTLNPAG